MAMLCGVVLRPKPRHEFTSTFQCTYLPTFQGARYRRTILQTKNVWCHRKVSIPEMWEDCANNYFLKILTPVCMRKLKINTCEILRFWRGRLSLCFNVSLFDISIIASLIKFDAATQFTKRACVFSLFVFFRNLSQSRSEF